MGPTSTSGWGDLSTATAGHDRRGGHVCRGGLGQRSEEPGRLDAGRVADPVDLRPDRRGDPGGQLHGHPRVLPGPGRQRPGPQRQREVLRLLRPPAERDHRPDRHLAMRVDLADRAVDELHPGLHPAQPDPAGVRRLHDQDRVDLLSVPDLRLDARGRPDPGDHRVRDDQPGPHQLEPGLQVAGPGHLQRPDERAGDGHRQPLGHPVRRRHVHDDGGGARGGRTYGDATGPRAPTW